MSEETVEVDITTVDGKPKVSVSVSKRLDEGRVDETDIAARAAEAYVKAVEQTTKR